MIATALVSDHAKPLEKEVQRFRLNKSPAEIILLKKASDLSSEGFVEVCHVLLRNGRGAVTMRDMLICARR